MAELQPQLPELPPLPALPPQPALPPLPTATGALQNHTARASESVPLPAVPDKTVEDYATESLNKARESITDSLRQLKDVQKQRTWTKFETEAYSLLNKHLKVLTGMETGLVREQVEKGLIRKTTVDYISPKKSIQYVLTKQFSELENLINKHINDSMSHDVSPLTDSLKQQRQQFGARLRAMTSAKRVDDNTTVQRAKTGSLGMTFTQRSQSVSKAGQAALKPAETAEQRLHKFQDRIVDMRDAIEEAQNQLMKVLKGSTSAEEVGAAEEFNGRLWELEQRIKSIQSPDAPNAGALDVWEGEVNQIPFAMEEYYRGECAERSDKMIATLQGQVDNPALDQATRDGCAVLLKQFEDCSTALKNIDAKADPKEQMAARKEVVKQMVAIGEAHTEAAQKAAEGGQQASENWSTWTRDLKRFLR